jgi:hypothetical protein
LTSGTGSPPLSPASSTVSATSSNADDKVVTSDSAKGSQLWPAWVYCTRYSDRPSSGECDNYCPIYSLCITRLKISLDSSLVISCI